MKLFDDLRQQFSDIRLLLAGAGNIHFLSSHGNMGDELIYAGTRRLLLSQGVQYQETKLSDFSDNPQRGDIALISGGGAWCKTWGDFMPDMLLKIHANFGKTIVLPSSFQLTDKVRRAAESPGVVFFCRERVSYAVMRDICDARLSHDHAFYFDYPDPRAGSGTLHAYRQDPESAGRGEIPQDNVDISLQEPTLHSWLHTIESHQTVYTDRAHVLIAAAMMGKEVFWWESNYHKIPAIVRYSLSEFENVKYMGKENPIKE